MPMMNPASLIQPAHAAVEQMQPVRNYQAEAPPGWNDPPAFNRPTRTQVS